MRQSETAGREGHRKTSDRLREVGHCLVILSVGLALRLPFMSSQGYPSDTRDYARWSWKAATMGIHTLYEPSAGVTSDNHPLVLYPLGVVGKLYARLTEPATAPPDQPSPLLLFLLRCPATLCDLLMGIVAYAWARRGLGHRRAAIVLALVVFNPAIFCDSVVYGQVDSIHALLALAAAMLIDRDRYRWGWGVMGLAFMAKPQTYVLGPLLAIVTLRRFGWRALLEGGLACAGGIVAVGIPFLAGGTVSSLAHYMTSIAAIHPMVSMNADNFWWLATSGSAASRVDVSALPPLASLGLPLSYRHAGILLLLLLHVPVWYRAWLTPRAPAVLAWAAVSVVVFFNVCTQMHETYLYLAIPFLAVTCFFDRRLAVLYGLLTATFVANVALHFPAFVQWLLPEHPDIFGGRELFPLRLAVSILNTAAMAWILWSLARRGVPEKIDG